MCGDGTTGALGVDGGWTPLSTCPQRYCDPMSLVLIHIFLRLLLILVFSRGPSDSIRGFDCCCIHQSICLSMVIKSKSRKTSGVEVWVLIGVGRPSPPTRNDNVTPRCFSFSSSTYSRFALFPFILLCVLLLLLIPPPLVVSIP